MTSLLLIAALYLLLCCGLLVRRARCGSVAYCFGFQWGAQRCAGLVEFRSFTVGAALWRRGCGALHLGFLVLHFSRDEAEDQRLAQSKADAKAVDSLLASLQKSAAK